MSKISFHLGFVWGQIPLHRSKASVARKQIPLSGVLDTRQPVAEGHELVNMSNTPCVNKMRLDIFNRWVVYKAVRKWRIKGQQLKVQTLSSKFIDEMTGKILRTLDTAWRKQVSLGLEQQPERVIQRQPLGTNEGGLQRNINNQQKMKLPNSSSCPQRKPGAQMLSC